MRARVCAIGISSAQALASASIVLVLTTDNGAPPSSRTRTACVVLALLACLASTLHAVLQPSERARAHAIASFAYGDVHRITTDPEAPASLEQQLENAERWIRVITGVGTARPTRYGCTRPQHQRASRTEAGTREPTPTQPKRPSRARVHPLLSPQSALHDSITSAHALYAQTARRLQRRGREHDVEADGAERQAVEGVSTRPEYEAVLRAPENAMGESWADMDRRSTPPFERQRPQPARAAPAAARLVQSRPVTGASHVPSYTTDAEASFRPTIVRWQPTPAPQLDHPRARLAAQRSPRQPRLPPVFVPRGPNTPTPVPLTLQPSSESGKAGSNVEDETWTTTAVETPASSAAGLI